MQNTTMRPIPADGTALTATVGSHTIHLQRTIEDGFTLYVTAGAHCIDELTDQFTDETMARTAASTIFQRLTAGESIHQLVADRAAADANITAGIRQAMDAAAENTTYQQQRKALNNAWDGIADRNRVNTKPAARGVLSPRLLAQAFEAATPAGDIYVGNGVSARFLEAMHRHGLGALHVGGPRSRYEIVKLHLSPAGWVLAGQHAKETTR